MVPPKKPHDLVPEGAEFPTCCDPGPTQEGLKGRQAVWPWPASFT